MFEKLNSNQILKYSHDKAFKYFYDKTAHHLEFQEGMNLHISSDSYISLSINISFIFFWH